MAGWPRNFPRQQGYFQPEMPVYAPPGPVLYDPALYGGNAIPPMAPEYCMNGPPQNFYPYQNPVAPTPVHNSTAYSAIPPGVEHPQLHPPVPQNLPTPAVPQYTQPIPAAVPVVPPAPAPLPKPPANLGPPVNFGAIPVAQREAEILDFWKQRFVLSKPNEEPLFPDKFALRLVVGLDKRAVEGLEVIFKEADKSSMLIFEEDPPSNGNVPNHLKCLCRCRWDPKKNWIVGYGATPAEAKNEVAVEALKQLLTPEEYSLIVEINRPERFISLDAQKLAQALNQYAESQGGTSRKRKSSMSSENSSLPFEHIKTTIDIKEDQDSDYSIGGSGAELTGEEDECDDIPPVKKQNIKLRKDLYARENRIIKFWLSKRPNPNIKPFPDIFRLRNMRNVSKRSRSAVMILFQTFQRHLRPVFQHAPNPRPDLGYFHVRCSWDNFKQNIHGYGNTPDLAENDAGVKALIKVLGEEEYAMLDEMTREELYEGLDMARIHAHIAYKTKGAYQRALSSQHSLPLSKPTTPGFNFENELLNYPKTLRKFPPAGKAEVPKPQFKLMSKKLRHYGKLEASAGFNSVDKIAPFQLFEKLLSIENLKENAVAALGSLFAELAEPIPSYTATSHFSRNSVKVECVARGKYFVEEAATEELAKNSAALSALKFLVGEEGLEKLLKAQADKSKS